MALEVTIKHVPGRAVTRPMKRYSSSTLRVVQDIITRTAVLLWGISDLLTEAETIQRNSFSQADTGDYAPA